MIFMRFPDGKAKALTFSYDDGVEQDAQLIFLLDAHGMKGTFNLNSGLFALEDTVYPAGQAHRRMTRNAAQSLYAPSRHEVAAHAYTHCSLNEVPDEEIIREIMLDRLELERDYGGQVRGLAYPFGRTCERVKNVIRSCGIQYARTVKATHSFDLPEDFLEWNPTCHHKDPELTELAGRFLAAKESFQCKLFYVWGHSYEFERDDNWGVMQAFMDYLAGQPSVWYATNMEIAHYCLAYRRLMISADGKNLYNPTDQTIWFERDYALSAIHPGQTLQFDA